MGAVLDSAEDIRQDKKNTSRQAHKAEEKLAKDQDKGVKMAYATTNTKLNEMPDFIEMVDGTPRTHIIVYQGTCSEHYGKRFVAQVVASPATSTEIYVFPQLSHQSAGQAPREVPGEIRKELPDIVQARFGNDKNPVFLNS